VRRTLSFLHYALNPATRRFRNFMSFDRRWLETVGLRPIVTREELAVLELRGGTHVVVRQASEPPAPGTGAPFDLMVDDVDAAHRDYAEKGLSPSPIRRGRIHDSFDLSGPDGWAFTVNSSHASGEPI
jgi:hypothetical protein